ncbi:MAG: hypothetical protein JNJ50_06725 [Acidobacteria bacterium]|nr:hypothetical protein [Acidobacteriota bacterium]
MAFKTSLSVLRRFQITALVSVSLLLPCLVASWPKLRVVRGQNTVTTVSAASYGTTLTPNGIASAFGSNLATTTLVATSQPLPTSLGGTTVRVNGQLAPLFFVSPFQINFMIPSNTPTGTQAVVITAGNGVTSNGTVQVSAAAPAIFTANSSGSGFPAAVLLRLKGNGQQIYDVASKAIDFGPVEDRLFLILYLCGTRAASSNTRVIVGSTELTPGYVGEAPGFAGLDQINVELPRSLAGRGKLALLVRANSINSNAVELEFSGTPPPTPGSLQINSLNPGQALAGDELIINGNGFSSAAADNQVFLVDASGNEVAAQMVAATGTQLRARVPFGSATGNVRVRTPQGEAQSPAPLSLRTSVSGFIEEVFTVSGQQNRRAIPNVTVRIRPATGPAITQRTGADGSFVLPDVPAGLTLVEIDTTTAALPYPSRTTKMLVQANRDNQFPTTIELQSVSANNQNSLGTNAGQQGGGMVTINNGTGLATTFGLPNGCQVTQPPGATTERLAISLFESGRAPAAMPTGYFSSAIAQISPFGAQMSPRGTLRLPNADSVPSGTQLKLFRYDQPVQGSLNLNTVAVFNEVGTAQVAGDGRIDVFENNAGNGVTQTTFYFVSPLYPLARVTGRVLGSDGRPVTRALVQTRGQSAFTRSDGSFTLENVPVMRNGDAVTLEVSYMRPDRAIDRTQRTPVSITANTTTSLGADIVLPGRLSPTQPLLIAPPRLTVNESQTLDFGFVALSQPVGQSVQVTTTGVGFASVSSQGNGDYSLRLAPGGNSQGEYIVLLTATNGAGEKYLHTIAVRVRRPPTNAPTANDISVITSAGTARNITLSASDPLGRQMNLPQLSSPSGGTITGSNPNLIYTPRAGVSGLDSFTYRAVVIGTAIQSDTSFVYVIIK